MSQNKKSRVAASTKGGNCEARRQKANEDESQPKETEKKEEAEYEQLKWIDKLRDRDDDPRLDSGA